MSAPRVRPRALAAALAVALGAAGCSSDTLFAPDLRSTVATATVPFALVGGADGRARFREAFCAAAGRERASALSDEECDTLLVRLRDEPAAAPPAPSGAPAPVPVPVPVFPVMFVPGLASDCAGQAELIDAELRPTLERLGHAFRTLPVSGLSSGAANARRLAEALLASPADMPPVVLLTHSKGTVDALNMLVDHPATVARVAAVVSLAGAVGGSPLARLASGDALAIAAWSPGMRCDAGDLGALDSLVPEGRQRWLAEHPLPASVRYYSLVAMPGPGRISPGLVLGHRLLSRIDPRNDGNVLFSDQVIPGATLLGYANADHWTIASNLSGSANPIVRAAAGAMPFPRRAMVEALVETIRTDLAAGAPAGTPRAAR